MSQMNAQSEVELLGINASPTDVVPTAQHAAVFTHRTASFQTVLINLRDNSLRKSNDILTSAET